ncbi:hypothetical protein PFISCL1PPCAC_11992, partial [Pristionchus fissidentatus]
QYQMAQRAAAMQPLQPVQQHRFPFDDCYTSGEEDNGSQNNNNNNPAAPNPQQTPPLDYNLAASLIISIAVLLLSFFLLGPFASEFVREAVDHFHAPRLGP